MSYSDTHNELWRTPQESVREEDVGQRQLRSANDRETRRRFHVRIAVQPTIMTSPICPITSRMMERMS